MSQSHALNDDTSKPSRDISGRLFIVASSLGISAGVVATIGMLLAAAAFATASTIGIPLVATFEGFRDAEGVNAVTVTGSWATAVALTIILAFLLSFFILRRFESSADPHLSS